MYLGIDVGGTHTDGALLDQNYELIETVKVPTRSDDVLGSFLAALTRLLADVDPIKVKRLVVSSTLGLNTILTGRADPVGVLATSGPGLPPDNTATPFFAVLGGSLDHRGEALALVSAQEAEAAAADLMKQGATAFAVISKFGPKNPTFEDLLAGAVQAAAPGRPVTRASRLAGRLNFPRRLNTAVFNSAVTRLYDRFIRELKGAMNKAGLDCPVSLLTADGGALPLERAAQTPVYVLAAGPAAGLLGLWSMVGSTDDALMIDIGGTSTDLAVMADGEPLMTPEGLTINGRPTLVRAFLTHSIALGGDSRLSVVPGRPDTGPVTVGPVREGPAVALKPGDLGRRAPTLTDALNVLDLTAVGEVGVSRQALAGLSARPPEETATHALNTALAMIKDAADHLLKQVNNRPVYTVGAVRLARSVRPARAAILGGPSTALAEPIGRALKLPAEVPEAAQVANAIGAARARPCLAAELYADTALGAMTIPALNLSETIDRNYNQTRAENDILEAMRDRLKDEDQAGPPQIIEAESFNQLVGYGVADKIIRIRAQAAPGFLKGAGS